MATDNQTVEDKKLRQVVSSTDSPLLSVKTVFPFSFFPERISVYRLKVDILFHHFFFSYSVFTILIDDLVSAKISTNLFFASLSFELKNFEKNPEPINFLPVTPAARFQHLVNGLIAARNAKVDLTTLSDEELLDKVLAIGQPEKFEPQQV